MRIRLYKAKKTNKRYRFSIAELQEIAHAQLNGEYTAFSKAILRELDEVERMGLDNYPFRDKINIDLDRGGDLPQRKEKINSNG